MGLLAARRQIRPLLLHFLRRPNQRMPAPGALMRPDDGFDSFA